MRNYKFNITDTTNFIDLNQFKNVLLEFKSYQADKSFPSDIYKTDHECLNSLQLNMIKYNFERYTGIILKFNTPIEDNKNKLTTVKIFSSGKLNIDGSNNLEQSTQIKKIISQIIYSNKDSILYTK